MAEHPQHGPGRTPPPATPIDLSVLQASIDTAEERERPIVVAAVGPDGNPAISIRGSIHVHSTDQLALWVRKRDDGFVTDIAHNPNVMLTYYDPAQGPVAETGARRLVLEGRAHVEESLDDLVWERIPEFERGRDANRRGIAVLIDIDRIVGATGQGPLNQQR